MVRKINTISHLCVRCPQGARALNLIKLGEIDGPFAAAEVEDSPYLRLNISKPIRAESWFLAIRPCNETKRAIAAESAWESSAGSMIARSERDRIRRRVLASPERAVGAFQALDGPPGDLQIGCVFEDAQLRKLDSFNTGQYRRGHLTIKDGGTRECGLRVLLC